MARKKSFKKLNKIKNRVKKFKPLKHDCRGHISDFLGFARKKYMPGTHLKVGEGYDFVSFKNFIEKVENTTITDKTINNYIDQGYMSKGWYIDSPTNQCLHRMYHPFSILEYLTAFHLLRGSWLGDYKKASNEKQFRLAQATNQDIFIGRLAFLRNGYAQKIYQACQHYKLYPFGGYYFDTRKYFGYIEPDNGFYALPCNFDNDLFPCYDHAAQMLEKQFLSKENVEAYIAYCEMIYRCTFKYFYYKYIEDIVKNIPKELPQFPK